MDDMSKRGPTDRNRINLSQEHEVKYWTQALGVSKAALEAAVREAGTSADKVRSYLKKH